MSKNILVVDTPDPALHALVQTLGEHGYLPVVLLESDDPVGQFVKAEYELVFISLQGVDARRLCGGIRQLPEGAITPVIFVGTGKESIRSPADALANGGDYYFSLPLDMTRVLAKVTTYVGPATPTPRTAGQQQLPPPPDFAPPPGLAASSLAGASDAVLAKIADREAELGRLAEAARRRAVDEETRRTQRSDATGSDKPSAEPSPTRTQPTRSTTAPEPAATLDPAVLARQAEAEAEIQRAAEQVRERAAAQVARDEARRADERKRLNEERAQQARQERQKRAQAETVRRAEAQARHLAEQEAAPALSRPDHSDPLPSPPPANPTTPDAFEDGDDDITEVSRPPLPQRTSDARRVPSRGAHREVVEESPVQFAPRALEPPHGTLSPKFDAAMLFVQLSRQTVTGRIDLQRGAEHRSFFFEHGVPVDASSNQPFDRIEEYLHREGKITQSQYQSVRLKQLRSARQVGAYLVSANHLKPEELFAAVRGHLEEQVYGLFEWQEGTYQYVAQVAKDIDKVALDIEPRALLLEGIRRKYVLPRLVARIGSPSTLVTLTETAQAELPYLRLSVSEQAAVRWLDGQRNIEDVVLSGGLEALRVYQVIYALLCLDAAQVLVRGLEGQQNADGTADIIDRARIVDKVEQVRFADYFQILGLARTATPYEIDRAVQRMVEEFRENRFSPTLARELGAQLQEIAEVLDEAREVLSDTERREAYARHLP